MWIKWLLIFTITVPAWGYNLTQDFLNGFYWATLPINIVVEDSDSSRKNVLIKLAEESIGEWERKTGLTLWDLTASGSSNMIRWSTNFAAETKMDLNMESYPHMLSGGQAQMVAILRALIINPSLLLIDEPFTSLDQANHIDTLFKIRRLHEEKQFTVLLVSHNIDEAILMSDKMLVLSKKPTRLLGEIPISLPTERKIGLMASQEFLQIKSKALQMVSDSKSQELLSH